MKCIVRCVEPNNRINKVVCDAVDRISVIQDFFEIEVQEYNGNGFGNTINWEQELQNNTAKDSNPEILVSRKPFADRWFSHGEANFSIISASGWMFSTVASPEAFILSEIALSLACFAMGPGENSIPYHKEPIGCLFDFCQDKRDMRWKVRVGHICPTCIAAMKTNNVPDEAIVALEAILDRVRAVSIGKGDREDKKNLYSELTSVLSNMKDFWVTKGEEIVDKYKDDLKEIPGGNKIDRKKFKSRLKKSSVFVISANQVEGNMITRILMRTNEGRTLDRYVDSQSNVVYQFSQVGRKSIAHIWPAEMSSFTTYGSFSALMKAFDIKKPSYVISLGVAFGNNSREAEEQLGDVLVAKKIVAYDAINKITDGTLSLKDVEDYETDNTLISNWLIYLSQPKQLESECKKRGMIPFCWYLGEMLSGGSVISDIQERNRLFGALPNRRLIGGEMEGHGVYFACKQEEIPCITIKGICDWAALKNGWKKVIGQEAKYDTETVKSCVQAFAVENAFLAMEYLLEKIE